MITKIKQVGASQTYKVFEDDNLLAVLHGEIILKNNVKVGDEMNGSTLANLKNQSDKIISFEQALNYLSRGIKSKLQLENYLKKRGYNSEVVQHAMSKLESYGYINNCEYAKAFVSTYKNSKSLKMLAYELRQAGVDQDICEQALQDVDDQELLGHLIEKFTKNKEMDEKNRQKLIRNLLSKGFGYNEVLSALRRIDEDRD